MKATRITDSTSGICDIGLDCCPHGRVGTNQTGSNICIVEGLKIHREGDTGSCNCPHGGSFISVGHSKIFYVENKGVALTSQQTVCTTCGMSGSHSSGSNILEVSI